MLDTPLVDLGIMDLTKDIQAYTTFCIFGHCVVSERVIRSRTYQI